VGRVFGVLDAELARREHIAGPRYGVADVMTWPWIDVHGALGLTLDPYPNLKRWHEAVGKRPAVRRGVRVPEMAHRG
jgi:GSH-dependent disulfide-bond oxidoreductase